MSLSFFERVFARHLWKEASVADAMSRLVLVLGTVAPHLSGLCVQLYCESAGMSEQILALAQGLLEKIGKRAPIEELADLVSDDLVFEVAGDATAMPWVGPPKIGRQAFTNFIQDQRELLTTDAFRVDDILHNDTRAVILGELSSTVIKTTRVIQTYFALILTISDNRITRFQMMEDSYAVSLAAR